MYNYRLAKINPISALKHSVFLAVSISLVFFVLDILWLFVQLIISLFTHGSTLVILERGGVQLFFTLLVLMLGCIGFGALATLLSIIYNYSSKWFDGIKVHVEDNIETEIKEDVENSKIAH